MMCGLSTNERPTPEEHARGESFKQKLQRLNVRFSEASLNLSQSVHIQGVAILEPEAVAHGAFADIYLGDYRGHRVAVKRLRATSHRHADQLGNIASVCM